MQHPTTLDETVMRLGTAVRCGVLATGSRLPPERDLADRLCINRSTLRHALSTLVDSGHLVSLRGRAGGTFVAEAPPLSIGRGDKPLGPDPQALLDHRVAIESGATLLAAERAKPTDLDQLDEPVDRMAAAKTYEDYRRADVRFHIGLAEAAHSPRLVTVMTEVHDQMTDLTARIAHPQDRLTRSNRQHARLVTLLRRADSRVAVLLVREHIKQTEQILAGRTSNVARPRRTHGPKRR